MIGETMFISEHTKIVDVLNAELDRLRGEYTTWSDLTASSAKATRAAESESAALRADVERLIEGRDYLDEAHVAAMAALAGVREYLINSIGMPIDDVDKLVVPTPGPRCAAVDWTKFGLLIAAKSRLLTDTEVDLLLNELAKIAPFVDRAATPTTADGSTEGSDE